MALQLLARRRAAREGLLPIDPVRFMDRLCDEGLMRRVGGGYQFRHRAILERLALEAPSPGLAELRERISPTPKSTRAQHRLAA
jgi:hypothetical protein